VTESGNGPRLEEVGGSDSKESAEDDGCCRDEQALGGALFAGGCCHNGSSGLWCHGIR